MASTRWKLNTTGLVIVWILAACGAPQSPTAVTVLPIQSAVAGAATLRAGQPGTATLNALNASPLQADAATAPAVSSAPAGTAAAQIDPCALITQSDVQTAVGVAIREPSRATAADGTVSCQFVGSGANPPTFLVTVYQGRTQVAAAQSQMNNGPAVAELGDQAVLAGGALYVRSGSQYFSVRVMPGGGQPADPNAVARAIALIVVPRLVSAAPPASGTANP